jgi:CRISPR type IV-associated DEAD/DEAH-box helicase Csf4
VRGKGRPTQIDQVIFIMPSVTVRIPDSLRKSGYIAIPLAGSAKSRLTGILSQPDLTPPKAPVPEISAHVNFWINGPEKERLHALGESQGLSIGETITALLVREEGLWKGPVKSAAKEVACDPYLAKVLKHSKRSQRVEQCRFYDCLKPLIESDLKLPKVLFAEAGTGIGKTLAYLTSVHAYLSENRVTQAAVAVPTHALMDQVLQEWRKVEDAVGPMATVPVIGQNEFVSVQALELMLQALDESDEPKDVQTCTEIRKWMKAGGPAAPNAVIRHSWTIGALRLAATAFANLDDVTLANRETDEDAGFESYKSQWERIPASRLIVFSHAMLASLVRKRLSMQASALKDTRTVKKAKAKSLKSDRISLAQWKAMPSSEREVGLYKVLNQIYADARIDDGLDMLPNIDLLVVDEAHTLEDSFDMVLSQNISIKSLKFELEKLSLSNPKQVPQKSVKAIEEIWKSLQGSSTFDRLGKGAGPIFLQDDNKQCLIDLNNALSPLIKINKAELLSIPGFRRVCHIARSLEFAVEVGDRYKGSLGVMIDWSPTRKWPRLLIGRMSVARELDYLWTAVARRSILVSGTLYEEVPQLSCESARKSLSVPFDSMMTTEPIFASWQTRPVTICRVALTYDPDGRARFVRPVLDVKNLTDAKEIGARELNYSKAHLNWICDVSKYLLKAHRVSEGGMMILGTAFDDINAIAEYFKETDIKKYGAVLVQRPGIPLGNLRKEFLQAAEDGMKPILMAVGGAWTGFDLYSSVNPNALTDLAILNAPFGAVSRSLVRAHRGRNSNNGGILEVVALMLILVRQGIGRLVRSPDTPDNRRIHWLDARIHMPFKAAQYNPIKRYFAKYKQLEVS